MYDNIFIGLTILEAILFVIMAYNFNKMDAEMIITKKIFNKSIGKKEQLICEIHMLETRLDESMAKKNELIRELNLVEERTKALSNNKS